ncbi:MAG: hypothetical protein Q9162_007519 [Coniocarpon cinnabarinum]
MATMNRLGSYDTRRFKGCTSIADYEIVDKLGEGTFGVVHKARHRRDGHVVAIKQILMHSEKDGFPITALREIRILKSLSHINILKLEEMAIERAKAKEQKKAIVYMVTPYSDHDLSGLLENPAVAFTEAQIKCYMLQLLDGLRFLHAQKILHRDIKAANLLISNAGILSIADFGLARQFDGSAPKPGLGNGEAVRDYTGLVVTRWYRPPELLLGLRRYTCAIDIWGAGCIFGEMFEKQPILSGKTDLNQAHIIFDLVGTPNEENMPGWNVLPGFEGQKDFSPPRTGNIDKRFSKLSPPALSLLKNLLNLNWQTRFNAHDALRHAYFTTPPLPSLPHELPKYNDSHELDRKRFREMKDEPLPPQNVLPPAPAGGGMAGTNDEFHGLNYGDRDRRDDRRNGRRFDDRDRDRYRDYDRPPPRYDDRERDRRYDDRRYRDRDNLPPRDDPRERDRFPDSYRERSPPRRPPPDHDVRRPHPTSHPEGAPEPRRPAWKRDPPPPDTLPPRPNGLPPRPDVAVPAWDRARRDQRVDGRDLPPAHRDRDRDRDRDRRDDRGGGGGGGRDTYIPSYSAVRPDSRDGITRDGRPRSDAGSRSGSARYRESRSRSPTRREDRERRERENANPYGRR